MSENLNNPNTASKGELLPENGEVRVDLHLASSDVISLDELKQRREALRLAEAAYPQKEVEKEATPRDLIGQRSVNLFMTRRRAAMAQELYGEQKDAA